jgi:hypothetical protein
VFVRFAPFSTLAAVPQTVRSRDLGLVAPGRFVRTDC